MILMTGVKVLSDLALYLAVVGSFFPAAAVGTAPLWGILCCAAGAALGAAADRVRPGMRLVGLAGPAAAALLSPDVPGLLLLLPALLYTCAMLVTGRLYPELGRCRDGIPARLIGLGGLLVFALLGMVPYRCAVLYGGLFVLTAFFLLRQLRLQRVGGWRSRGLDLLALLAVAVGGGALALAVWGLFHLPFSPWDVVGWAIWLLAYGMQFLFFWLEWLIKWLASLSNGQSAETPAADFSGLTPIPTTSSTELSPVVKMIFAVIAVLILAAVVAAVIRRMLGGLHRLSGETPPPFTTERVEAAPTTRRRGLFPSDRDRVRGCYRKFLKLLRRRGVPLEPSMTTGDIRRFHALTADPQAAEALRQLYLAARYDQETEVTSQQAREARELVKAISRETEAH